MAPGEIRTPDHLVRSQIFNDAVMGQINGAQLPRIGWSSFAEILIPLPPLEVQEEIVAEIEGYMACRVATLSRNSNLILLSVRLLCFVLAPKRFHIPTHFIDGGQGGAIVADVELTDMVAAHMHLFLHVPATFTFHYDFLPFRYTPLTHLLPAFVLLAHTAFESDPVWRP